MRDKDLEPTFPWTLLFFITGLCYFVFAGILKLLNTTLPVVFFWIGIVSVSLGCISAVGSLVLKLKMPAKREELSTAE